MVDYTNTTVTGYNASPPSDDGTVSEANRTKWDTILTKLAAPLKTAIESINTNLTTSFGSIPTLVGSQSMWVSASNMVGSTLTTTTDGDTTIQHLELTNSATDPFAHFSFVLPNKWALSDLTVRLYFLQHELGSGDVRVKVSAGSLNDGDAIDSGYGTSVSQDISCPGTRYDVFMSENYTITVGNTPASGDVIVIEVERDHAATEDDYANDVGLLGAKITYTGSAVTDD